jgi:hypothetical protein
MKKRLLSGDEVAQRLRARAVAAGGMRALGREWGMSHAYISDIVRRTKEPGSTILRLLGLAKVKVVMYSVVPPAGGAA